MLGIIGVGNEIIEIDVGIVKPNPSQPRKHCDEDGINALASDIIRRGLIHPVIVIKDGEFFTIVCGQRRLIAAKKAGCATIRAMVLLTNNEALETALVENMLRKDLAAFDQAEAFQVLMNEKNLCLKDIAQLVGKSISSVCETVNLMRIPQELRHSDIVRQKPLRFQIKLSKYGSEEEIDAAFKIYEKTGQLPRLKEKSRDRELTELTRKIASIKTIVSNIDFLDLDFHNEVHTKFKGEIIELLSALHGRGWFRIDLMQVQGDKIDCE